jgi:hypothetical protein
MFVGIIKKFINEVLADGRSKSSIWDNGTKRTQTANSQGTLTKELAISVSDC